MEKIKIKTEIKIKIKIRSDQIRSDQIRSDQIRSAQLSSAVNRNKKINTRTYLVFCFLEKFQLPAIPLNRQESKKLLHPTLRTSLVLFYEIFIHYFIFIINYNIILYYVILYYIILYYYINYTILYYAISILCYNYTIL